MWTIVEEEALISDLKNLVVSGWKCDNGFQNGYLAQLEVHMHRAFPLSHIKAEPHITSKLHVWKKQYSTLVTMMSKSGLGWDDNRWIQSLRGCVTRHGLSSPLGARFLARIEPRGAYCATPPPRNEDTNMEKPRTQDCYVPTAEWNPETGFVGQEEDPPVSYNVNVDPTVNSSSATKRTTTSTKKRKAEGAWPEIPQLVSMVTNFCDTANNRLGSLTRVLEKEFGDPDQRE
ncbi:UNVERIFIED_CONTAM: hypothetical protein Sradi_1512600 [Sesamum radiatum]|uniref:Myb/SANT-like domain-containing protein n=1 Tax=Sesamum radiatum TaxID=300843 RepID=A0AAW2U7E2_SESRA